ncbi:stage V sporulation protein AF [Paenibacillus uliginis N3/975]|uniref:Stage V sporulation protein AF n=1 Tax=Paenibacillus uliginis N3/975 TaxID=1313296 RepID=A0A1X7HJT2_9BACL|nr:spore germination protein [Paenibacillus uliginis]SMF87566.1 stage V sporulation protein AF [Paenibacillus uliginis N3/975]
MDDKTGSTGYGEENIPVVPPSVIKSLEEEELVKKREAESSDNTHESVVYWQGSDEIPSNLKDLKGILKEVVGLGVSFDVVLREMTVAGRKTGLLFLNGFTNDVVLTEILDRFTYLTSEDVGNHIVSTIKNQYIPYVQVEEITELSEAINNVLSGLCTVFFEGEHTAILLDTRKYPTRSPEEPAIERVVRGARDGFTESIVTNINLVRRRVRDPGLHCEAMQVGRRTQTDVCIIFIDDIVDREQVEAIRHKIQEIDLEGLPLGDKQLEEAIVNKGWHPYPLVRYSERPDVVASHLLEGRVVVMVDTSPSVMIMPTTFFDLCQHAEENRQTPFMGTYLRWIRFGGIFASMFLLPLWMLLVIHPELKPPYLNILGPREMGKIPIIMQFLIVEFGVDLMRLAAVHTPTPLASAMGLIAAILIGDVAVKTGLFVNEVMLYMAVAAVGMFATPSYELGLANRVVRLALLIAVAMFGLKGFVIGTTLLILMLTTHRSYNSSYLWPFIPFSAKAMGEVLFRKPLLYSRTRPALNKARDNSKMGPEMSPKRKQ